MNNNYLSEFDKRLEDAWLNDKSELFNLGYKYVYRKVSDDTWRFDVQIKPKDYFRLYYYNKKLFYNNESILYERTMLRRVIKPDITDNELLFCIMVDLMKFSCNIDGISVDVMKKIVLSVQWKSNECIEDEMKDSVEEHKRNTNIKGEVIYRNKKVIKESNFFLLDIEYRDGMTPNELLEIAVEKNLPIKNLKGIYEFFKKRKYQTNIGRKDEYKELLEKYDINKSIRRNMLDLGISQAKSQRLRNNKLLLSK